MSPTATTPLLTGAAVKPGEVPPTQDPRFITDDQAGAISFAAYFYRALDWSIATSNPNLLRPISSPGCKPASEYIQEIDSFVASGGHSEGGSAGAFKFAPVQGTLVHSDFVIEVTINQDRGPRETPMGLGQYAAASKDPGINYLYVTGMNGRSGQSESG